MLWFRSHNCIYINKSIGLVVKQNFVKSLCLYIVFSKMKIGVETDNDSLWVCHLVQPMWGYQLIYYHFCIIFMSRFKVFLFVVGIKGKVKSMRDQIHEKTVKKKKNICLYSNFVHIIGCSTYIFFQNLSRLYFLCNCN